MRLSPRRVEAFRKTVRGYYRREGRAMPWRRTRDPYKILVSEIMLQQTQVSRVLAKYPDFLRVFPNFRTLAASPFRRVIRVWRGMGYNRRALALSRIAKLVCARYGGVLPRDPAILETFPGIGAATARSIAAFAWNAPAVFIETNIRRVFIHFFFNNKVSISDDDILPLVARTLDAARPREWYYALMDYGAMLGKAIPNPNRRSSQYRVSPRFAGSDRELRGKIVKLFSMEGKFTKGQVAARLGVPAARAGTALRALANEGLLKLKCGAYTL